MPIPTSLLDNGNFVCSPEMTPRRAFSEYLEYADRLLGQWRGVHKQWSQSPYSAELVRQKNELDKVVSDFVETFKARYTIASVEQEAAFLPVSQFFARYRPLRDRFCILHCDREMPLHTVHRFLSYRDLAQVNSALEEKIPFPWWQAGPQDLPCFLYGEQVWQLKPSEVSMSETGLMLAFFDETEDRRLKSGRLVVGASPNAAGAEADFIPEKLRGLVLRRAKGNCEKCGGHEGIDFVCHGPPGKGGNRDPASVQLLCARCRLPKSTPA